MTMQPITAWQLETDERISPRAIGAGVVSVLVTLYAIALLLVARRAMGAFTVELSWPALVMTALCAFAVITGLRVLWRRTFPESTTGDQWIAWGSSLTLVLIAGGLSFPGRERDWFLWLPVLIADQFLRRRLFDLPSIDASELPAACRLSDQQTQQIVRTREADGSETVHATLRADFVPDQRTATVYVGFCPPLSGQPALSIEQVPGAECKIVQAFPHGARIDVRLTQVALEPTSVTVNVAARS